MKSRYKQILLPFVLMMVINLSTYFSSYGQNFGSGLNPHLGILFISGLLFGPYGALGAVMGNFICDLIRGYELSFSIASGIVSFLVSYFAYKMWYANFKGRKEFSKPLLNNTHSLLLFFIILTLCSLLFSVLHKNLIYLWYYGTDINNSSIGARMFFNLFNSSIIFAIFGTWLSKKIDFIHVPKVTEKKVNLKFYNMIFILLVIVTLISIILNYIYTKTTTINIAEFTIILTLIICYLKRPNTNKISEPKTDSVVKRIMNIFTLTILFIIIIGVLISSDTILVSAVEQYLPLTSTEITTSMLIFADIIMVIYLIPSFAVLRYIENNVTEPVTSFSKIEEFIKEDEKIETEGLVEIYSKYINENDEIGTLARSYTDLINYNNQYIENIHKIEGEKERIKTELDIATKIQQANLPRKPIENEQYFIDGFSRPAKEVGGDFFDYYELDNENLAVVIGDASGKGVPAALLSIITQAIIKQILNIERDPSKVLYLLNNQLYENNSETMFITLWLGIYNKTTKTLTFSNAGHNPPLVKENDKFKELNIDEGIVLGIMEDFEFEKEILEFDKELILYTDGITDAHNKDKEMYGEKELKKFFDNFTKKENPLQYLLNDVDEFVGDCEQFDDMTLIYFKIKND